MRESTRQPSMSGRKMSSRMAEGWNSFTIDSAEVPWEVTMPLKPWALADSSSTRANARSFSTISTTRSPGCTESRSSSASLIVERGGGPTGSVDSGSERLTWGSPTCRSAATRAASIAALATAAASLDLRAVRDGGKA